MVYIGFELLKKKKKKKKQRGSFQYSIIVLNFQKPVYKNKIKKLIFFKQYSWIIKVT